jgi:hypothetical protein
MDNVFLLYEIRDSLYKEELSLHCDGFWQSKILELEKYEVSSLGIEA